MSIKIDSLIGMQDRIKEELGVLCEVYIDGGFDFGVIISIDIPRYGGTYRTKHAFTGKDIDEVPQEILVDHLTKKIIESMKEPKE